MSDEYRALVAKVEAFTSAAAARRAADLACRAGCDGCCRAWLTVSAVEAEAVRTALAALGSEARVRVRERGVRELAREARGDDTPRCAMLEDDGTCAVYALRPLVCRTQGHALRYPEGFVPEDAVRGHTPKGDVTWCPLNYTGAPPHADDVLDAERVDQILALVNERFTRARGLASPERTALSALAAEGDVLGSGSLDDRDARQHTDGDR